jgi:hypothetical protein
MRTGINLERKSSQAIGPSYILSRDRRKLNETAKLSEGSVAAALRSVEAALLVYKAGGGGGVPDD